MGAAARLFHQVTVKDYVFSPSDPFDWEYLEESTERFLERFGGPLDFRDKTVIDVGMGSGVLCVHAARAGASHVVGVDLTQEFAASYLAARGSDVADRVELLATHGDLREVGSRQFDIVLSKDSFEHYAEPEIFIKTLTSVVAPGGKLVIGFGPLWKSPTGGHIDFMTNLPWAHLLFPEHVIMDERRRFRPDEDARCFAEIRGGLNKMTYRRFRAIVATSGLEPEYFATNVSQSKVVKAMRAVSRVPGLREYFTQSVYTILVRPL